MMASSVPRLLFFLLLGFLPGLSGIFFRPTDWYADLTYFSAGIWRINRG